MPKKKQGNKKQGKKGKGGGKKGGSSGGKLKNCKQVKARHILCEKLSKIQEAKSKLGGSPKQKKFSEVAREFSECPSAKKGGDLGWFGRGKMAKPFEKIAFESSEGSVSDIFKTQFGYHIVMVDKRK